HHQLGQTETIGYAFFQPKQIPALAVFFSESDIHTVLLDEADERIEHFPDIMLACVQGELIAQCQTEGVDLLFRYIMPDRQQYVLLGPRHPLQYAVQFIVRPVAVDVRCGEYHDEEARVRQSAVDLLPDALSPFDFITVVPEPDAFILQSVGQLSDEIILVIRGM